MRYTDDQLRFLLKEIIDSPSAKQWRDQRLIDHQKWREWIDLNKFTQLTDTDIRSRYLEYYEKGAGRHPFFPVFKARIIRNIDKFKELMEFLLNDKNSIEERMNKVLTKGEKYKIEGFGKGLTTSFLMDLNPEKYATWNNKTIMGLKELGLYPKFPRGSDWGACYILVMKALEYLKKLRPDLSFIEIDHFLHIIAVEDEGSEALKKLVDNFEVVSEVSQRIEEILELSDEIKFDSITKSLVIVDPKDDNSKISVKPESGNREGYNIIVHVQADMVHSKVVNTLYDLLKKQNFKPKYDRNRDLYLGDNKEVKKLFEVKTSVSSSSIQKGIGQLILYSLKLDKKPDDLILVLPKNLDQNTEQKLKDELNISILVYQKKGDKITFPSLDDLIKSW